MTKPLTKEARAEMRPGWLPAWQNYPHSGWSMEEARKVNRYLVAIEDSHAIVEEECDLATAKLATARVCEDCWRYQDNEKCDCCNNGVRFSDERARELLERLKRAEEACREIRASGHSRMCPAMRYETSCTCGYEAAGDVIRAARAKESK